MKCQNEVMVGEKLFYGGYNRDGQLNLSYVEIVRKFDRGAVVKFLEVYSDFSGNGYFRYLLKTGKTMNVSYKYLHRRMSEILDTKAEVE